MSRTQRKAVILDRDGVLNVPEFRDGRSYAPRRLDDFVLYPDAIRSVAQLRAAGFVVVVATNQPDVGAGLVRSEEHTSELQSLMRISYAVFCLKQKKHSKNR